MNKLKKYMIHLLILVLDLKKKSLCDIFLPFFGT